MARLSQDEKIQPHWWRKSYCIHIIFNFKVDPMKIRADVIRTYQKVYTWTVIIAGLFLFICFYAGSLTMFKPAIEQWAVPKSQIIAQTPIYL